MQRQQVTSSSIKSIGYDPEKQILEIEFKGKGDTPGGVYQYLNFTPEDFATFRAAKSIGTYFAAFIRGKFETKKLEPETDETGEKKGAEQK
jgi:KTSC domain